MLSSSQLPPPVSPFRPNLDALKLDVSDEEDGLGVDPQMNKLWASPNPSPSPSLGPGETGTPPTPQIASDDTSPRPSPRPRASTLAQSVSAQPTLPPLNTGRQFLRTASQPVNGLSPTLEQYSPDSAAPPRTVGIKRVLIPSTSKPSRPLSEVTPLNARKPLLSASAGKFLTRRMSPPRRVLVKDQREEEPETEDEERKPYAIAPRTTERNSILRPRKDGTPEHGRSLSSLVRSASSPDAASLGVRRLSPPTISPIESSPQAENPPSPPQAQHPLAQSSAATASTSSLASTASSLRGISAGSVKARLRDWGSSIGSWSKGKSRPAIPGMGSNPARPSLEVVQRALAGTDSARPSIDSAHESFDRPSLDTVRPVLSVPLAHDEPDAYREHVAPSDDERAPEYEEPEPLPQQRYASSRPYEPRSTSAAGWNAERDRERDRPGTSSGYYVAQSAQIKSVQNHHERRTSDTLRPSPLETPPSKSPLSSLRHKRSPTAPSPPTSTIIAREKENRAGQTWAAGQDPKVQERADAAGVGGSYGADVGGYAGMGREEGKALDRERERLREVENRRGERVVDMREREMEREMERDRMERDRERERPQSSQGLAMMPPPSTVSRDREAAAAKRDRFICNKQEYTVVDCIGRGGSSKVYKVISPNNKIYALKRVRLDSKVDEETMRGYVNEMQLLKRLDGNERIIKLIDSQAVGRGGRYLMMVMELGEIDLAKLLQERQGQLLQPHWIAIYWQQMLEAVQTIHDEKIVHSDLKPANFVLVKGSLKLIDFGIAKAIANDTTNIQREHQVGTLNYMSPESIEETQTANGRRLKLGRASDVWSLGCILYQMIYGRPPFYSITGAVPKLRAISDPNHVIDYPAASIPVAPASEKDGQPRQIPEWSTPVPPDVVDTLKGCLTRDPKQRRTIPELLDDPWLRSWRHTSTPAEVPKLKDNEAIVNEAWLKQIIEHASREAIENGALDEEAVSQMAQNLLPALRLANTKHPAYKQFC